MLETIVFGTTASMHITDRTLRHSVGLLWFIHTLGLLRSTVLQMLELSWVVIILLDSSRSFVHDIAFVRCSEVVQKVTALQLFRYKSLLSSLVYIRFKFLVDILSVVRRVNLVFGIHLLHLFHEVLISHRYFDELSSIIFP